jgi:folate-binding protein YgfZ
MADDNFRMSQPTEVPAAAAAPVPAPALPQGWVLLPQLGLIAARGPESASFLQGQLTQDVVHLEPGRWRLAGYCSPKGRLLATFWVWRDTSDPAAPVLWLACSADLLAATLKRLRMFVLRARCTLEDASASHRLVGLAGPAVCDWLGEIADRGPGSALAWRGGTLLRLADATSNGHTQPRWVWAGEEPGAQDLLQDLAAMPAMSPAAWQGLEAASGVARVVQATADRFVPQMVNLELVGGVNFQKGCYPGQEVVARSQYRGTLKRRARFVRCDSPLTPGQEVFHSADPEQPAGLVALAGELQGQGVALVELKLAALGGDGSLHLGEASGPRLSLADLPYPLPAEPA